MGRAIKCTDNEVGGTRRQMDRKLQEIVNKDLSLPQWKNKKKQEVKEISELATTFQGLSSNGGHLQICYDLNIATITFQDAFLDKSQACITQQHTHHLDR